MSVKGSIHQNDIFYQLLDDNADVGDLIYIVKVDDYFKEIDLAVGEILKVNKIHPDGSVVYVDGKDFEIFHKEYYVMKKITEFVK